MSPPRCRLTYSPSPGFCSATSEVNLESHSYNAMNKNTTLLGRVIHPTSHPAEAWLKEDMDQCVNWNIA